MILSLLLIVLCLLNISMRYNKVIVLYLAVQFTFSFEMSYFMVIEIFVVTKFLMQVQHVEDRVKNLLLQIQQGQVCSTSMNNFVAEPLNFVKT